MNDGPGFADDTFPSQWSHCKAYQIPRGAYDFAEPDAGPAEVEADFFLSLIGSDLDPEDRIALDVETGTGDLSAWVLAWFARIEEQEPGHQLYLYSRVDFLQAHGLLIPAMAKYLPWLADPSSPTKPDVPQPWTELAGWQSGQGTVPGIKGPVDFDTFYV